MVIRYNKTIKKNQQLRKKRQKKTQNKKTKKIYNVVQNEIV